MIKVLLIAFACEPNKGSEPAVGWNWAMHLAKYVKVTVVTRKNNKNVIENELKNISATNLSFLYFDIYSLSKIKKIIPFGVQLYYLLWELLVVKKIKKTDVDLVQRITFVTTVTLLRLYRLKKPYILSFAAGGETSPFPILRNYSLIYRIKENIRKNYNSFYQISPITRRIYSKSKLILAVTNETKNFIENIGVRKKIIVEPAIGLKVTCPNQTISVKNKIIYAGSLIYWKNVDILIKAIEKNVDEVKLDIFGKGEKKEELKKYVNERKLNEKIIFNEPISRKLLLDKYKDYDLAIHASSHDSGSMFLLEAISAGVPVLFLDTGGPKEIFNGIDYPLKVDPKNSYDEIVNSFTEKINWFYNNYDYFMKDFISFKENVVENYDWDNKAIRMVEIYKKILNENTSSSQ